MVKTTWRTDHPWSTIFKVMVYYGVLILSQLFGSHAGGMCWALGWIEARLAPKPTTGSTHSHLIFNFCGMVIGLVENGFSPTIKTVAKKFFNVNKTTIKICQGKKPVPARWFQVMGIPRWGRHCLTVIYSNIVPLNTKLFTKYLRKHPSKHIRTKEPPEKLSRCPQEP